MATQLSLTQQAGGDLDLLDALRGRGNRIKTQQELLREQSLAPVEIGSYNGIQGNFPVSQGFNKIAQGLLATYMDSQARDKAQAAADEKTASDRAGVNALIDALKGTPADDPLPEGMQGPVRPAQPPLTGDALQTALVTAVAGNSPGAARAAEFLMSQDQARQARTPPGFRVNPNGTQSFIPGGPADPAVLTARTAATQPPAQPPPGFRVNPDGNQSFIPGGPADPAVVRAASDAKSQGHPIPTGDRTKLVDAGSKLSELDRLGITFEDKYGGFGASFVGDITNAIGRNTPGESPRADWWQAYQSIKNVVRNDQFGAALTKTEKAEFEKADINPGMSADTIRNNMARQSAIVRGALERRGRSMLADGYKPEAVQEAVGAGIDFSKPAPKPPPAPGAPGTQDHPIPVKTIDEALKLPPLTWITRPDGTTGQVPPR